MEDRSPVSPSYPQRRLVFLALAVVSLSAGVMAQQAPPTPPAGPTAGQKYKNIQVLKDLPAAQLHDTMVFLSATVGGNCQSCHVRGADGEMAFEKDDNDHKVTARKMIPMTRAINDEHFKGEERVTCATCHQARREPSPLPPVAQPLTPDQLAALQPRPAAGPGGGPGVGGPPPAGAPQGQPAQPQRGQGPGPGAAPGGGRGPQKPTETVDEVLDTYIKALGGREAIQKLTTRTRRGTMTNRAGQSSSVTIEDTAAGQYRATIEGPPAQTTRAWDGKEAWTQSGNRVRDYEGVEAANVSLGADLSLAPAIKDTYAALTVQAYSRIAGHEVIVVQGRRPGGASESLMFDRATGLMARRLVRLKTPMGELPVQIDYADYRPVNGVQTAFEIHVAD
ncbi:MAG: c-type cytochrome, partial [Acidobacteria bacterium]|nr:c-type cytochrome [Acidobacteriota bacterium]